MINEIPEPVGGLLAIIASLDGEVALRRGFSAETRILWPVDAIDPTWMKSQYAELDLLRVLDKAYHLDLIEYDERAGKVRRILQPNFPANP